MLPGGVETAFAPAGGVSGTSWKSGCSVDAGSTSASYEHGAAVVATGGQMHKLTGQRAKPQRLQSESSEGMACTTPQSSQKGSPQLQSTP
jgi:hypothetical protein